MASVDPMNFKFEPLKNGRSPLVAGLPFVSSPSLKCSSLVLISNVTVLTSVNTKTKVIENQTITLKRQALSSLAALFNPKKQVHLLFELGPVEYNMALAKPKFKVPPRARTKKKTYVMSTPFTNATNTGSDVESFVLAVLPEKKEMKTFQVPQAPTFDFSFLKKLDGLKPSGLSSELEGLPKIEDKEDEYFHFRPFEGYLQQPAPGSPSPEANPDMTVSASAADPEIRKQCDNDDTMTV